MNRQHKFFALTLILGAFLIIPSLSVAERDCSQNRPQPGNVFGWILNMGNLSFDSSGGFCLPTGILQRLENGRLSSITQLILMTHTMSQCVKNVIKPSNIPTRRTAYATASAMFEEGMCKLTKCFQQAFTMTMLTETNRSLAATGLSEEEQNQSRQQLALAMFQAFSQGNERCGGDGQGFDTQLFQILGGLNPIRR